MLEFVATPVNESGDIKYCRASFNPPHNCVKTRAWLFLLAYPGLRLREWAEVTEIKYQNLATYNTDWMYLRYIFPKKQKGIRGDYLPANPQRAAMVTKVVYGYAAGTDRTGSGVRVIRLSGGGT